MSRLGLLTIVLVFSSILPAQSLVSKTEQAHGGKTLLQERTDFEVRGLLETPEDRSTFVLKVSGDNSRFETADRVTV